MPDPRYYSWMSMYHPEVSFGDLSGCPGLEISVSSPFDSPPASPLGSDLGEASREEMNGKHPLVLKLVNLGACSRSYSSMCDFSARSAYKELEIANQLA